LKKPSVKKIGVVYGKKGESYIIECHNCSHIDPLWRKIKEHTLSYIDIVSLKSIVTKLVKAKLTQGKEYNVIFKYQIAL
jgi:hypothetical protein